MSGGSDFHDQQSDDQIDTVLSIGIMGMAFHFLAGLVGEALGLPFLNKKLSITSLGIAFPLYVIWVVYRFNRYSPGDQPEAVDGREYGKKESE